MTHKEKAIEFLKMIINGDIEEAYVRFVNANGKHHNVHFKAGFDALKQAMKDNHTQFPNKRFDVVLAVSEDDKVALLTRVGIGDREYSISHFFRFESGKITEMWDTAQELPDEFTNIDGAF